MLFEVYSHTSNDQILFENEFSLSSIPQSLSNLILTSVSKFCMDCFEKKIFQFFDNDKNLQWLFYVIH